MICARWVKPRRGNRATPTPDRTEKRQVERPVPA
jgi:hypothetical protein